MKFEITLYKTKRGILTAIVFAIAVFIGVSLNNYRDDQVTRNTVNVIGNNSYAVTGDNNHVTVEHGNKVTDDNSAVQERNHISMSDALRRVLIFTGVVSAICFIFGIITFLITRGWNA